MTSAVRMPISSVRWATFVADHVVEADRGLSQRQHPRTRTERRRRVAVGSGIIARWTCVGLRLEDPEVGIQLAPALRSASAVRSVSVDVLPKTVSDGVNPYEYGR